LEEASHCLSQACRLQPKSAPFHFNRANLLRRCGDESGAEREYLEAIQYDSGLAEAYHGLGNLYFKEGNFESAEACLQKATELNKGFVPALYDLGQLRQRQGLPDEAEQLYRLSVAGDPNFLPALNSLGMLLLRKGQIDKARICFTKAIKADQSYLNARCNLAVLETWCGHLDSAINILQRALMDAPNDGDIHFNLALALLAAGRFDEGWREHEWRFGKSNPVSLRYSEIPRWHGEGLAGSSILIHAEQGYGDTLQFIRFASLLSAKGATVLVEGQDQIITPLLATVPGVTVAFSRGEKLAFKPDYQIPMMSLPLELGIDGAHPPIVKYLRPPENRMRFWRDTLSGLPGLKVGIAWSGRQEHVNAANRSISPDLLAPLCGMCNISWVSLQFGPDKPSRPPIPLFEPADGVVDFCDSAALVAGLDLVITVDSAIAHLAGGLGVTVWLLLPWNPDWRWMHDREESPWYPATRIYQQELEKPWSETIGTVTEDLLMYLKTHR
jgi:Flp pilus assembly protein TadD